MLQTLPEHPTKIRSSPALRVVTLCWLFSALIAGETGALHELPMPVVQGILLLLTLMILAAFRSWPTFREWVLNCDPRILISFHLSRFVGIYFLFLYSQAALPYGFAMLAGYGDIIIASTALLLLCMPSQKKSFGSMLTIWNVCGLFEIVVVLISAARIEFANPDSMRAWSALPLSILPTFVLPLLIASHLFLLLRRGR
ncbi:MAG: hypothetical protein J0M12_05995 [Deltaproteobacteria bacterium]|nr:hypothetical protein [Deltaproteobacteria bacterium]